MSNQKSTLPTSMPRSYQQALGKTTTDDYKNYELGDVPSENKQMLLAAENNSTKQEVSHQVNSNPNPQQLVQMTVVPVTSPPSTTVVLKLFAPAAHFTTFPNFAAHLDQSADLFGLH